MPRDRSRIPLPGAGRAPREIGRRRFLGRSVGGAAALLLGGCDRLSASGWFRGLLDSAEGLNRRVQQALAPASALAREYAEADRSPHFKANSTTDPDSAEYRALAANGFADWRLEIGGLVEHPASFSLDELRAMPSRTQITRHDCVEGWSCIGKWKGVPLGALLDRVGPKRNARYVVFYCADSMERGLDGSETRYYESIDLAGAHHPQTILAYEVNDAVLPVAHGAPLRLRDERQLGYKMAKYIMRIELVESFKTIAGGRGGYWEDLGYEWYAGI